MRKYFMETASIGFSKWTKSDLAVLLWGDPEVTRFLCAGGRFSQRDIENRLETEINNDRLFRVQYWPIFERATGELIGCCGARPFPGEAHTFETGFHLRKAFWGKGCAYEAAKAAMAYCFTQREAEKLVAGHHPQNEASKKLLLKLGFTGIGDRFYEPTGLYHPAYACASNDGKSV